MTTPTTNPGHGGPRCGGKRRRSPDLCTQAAGWGTSHPGVGRCKLHGGSTSSHVHAAQRAMAEHAVATYGLPRDIDPAEALLDEVRWTAGHVSWLRDRIQELEQDALVWGVTEQVERTATEFAGTDTTHKAIPSVWLDLYQKERKHLVDVCKAALAAGVEERRVRLAEQAGTQLAQVIRAVLTELGVADDPRVPGALQRAITDLHAA